MPFAPKIRRDIIAVLEEHVIPALEKQKVPQILAQPPFDFSQVEHEVLQKKFVAAKKYEPLQISHTWPEEMLMSVNMLTVMFAYEGICYERVGITHEQSRQLSATARETVGGVNILSMPAPAVLCHPPFMLRSLGQPRPESQAHHGRAFAFRISDTGLLVSLNVRGPIEEKASHPLDIHDPSLIRMAQLYLEELQAGDLAAAQAQQLAFMYRMKRYLLSHRPGVGNTAWVLPVQDTPSSLPLSKNQEFCRKVTAYIITNLHAPLTLQGLATQFGVSTVYLNSVFRQVRDTTVMRTVTQLRIEAAKVLLQQNREQMSEVAELVGFSSAASFSIVFKKYTGSSPHQFRYQHGESEVNENKQN
jgi:AraC-like DNA-binding protein